MKYPEYPAVFGYPSSEIMVYKNGTMEKRRLGFGYLGTTRERPSKDGLGGQNFDIRSKNKKKEGQQKSDFC